MSHLEIDPVEYEDKDRDIDEILDVMSNSEADFVYWGAMPFWSLEEGIALLLSKDPEQVTWETVRYYVNYFYSSELCWEYYKLRNLILRAKKLEELVDPIEPAIFLDWAEKRALKIPEKLVEEVTIRKKIFEADAKANEPNIELISSLTQLNELLESKDKQIKDLEMQLEVFQQRVLELEPLVWQGFDENLSTHSRELAIAVRAHHFISQNWRQGKSIKKQLHDWLRENHPKLLLEEKERIAKICNWKKSGGAPCTPELSG